jgi:ubiquinone/menaquinone biosynthesis C-methylase UbiE
MSILHTAERVDHTKASENYVYQRSLLAYVEATKILKGDVLELGTGSGYGIELIAPQVNKFVTIDQFETPSLKEKLEKFPNVEFIKSGFPPLRDIADNSFDFVVTFQVIEHIEDDNLFVKEIYRVLKNNGKLIVTTPNKKMSLTRNPWHVREYTSSELEVLLKKQFQSVDALGVFGNEKVNEYYVINKESVRKITRFDIFNLQYRLPRQLLQIPYDILNNFNRKKILKSNTSLVSNITLDDYFIAPAKEDNYDLFFIAEKKA